MRILFFTVFLFMASFFSVNQASAIDCPDGFKPVDQLCVPDNYFGSGGGLASSTSASEAITVVIKNILLLSGGLAVLFLIYGGIRLVTSGAGPDANKKAKAIIRYAIFGLVIILLSYVIVVVVTNLLLSKS